MIGVYHRVTQSIVLIAELKHGTFKLGALFETQSLCHASGCLVSYNDLKRNNGNSFYGSFSVAELLDIMCGDAFFLKHSAHEVRHFIVDNALAVDSALFQTVKCCGIVLVVNNQNILIIRCENFLCLSLVEQLFFLHCFFLLI